jgi:hypothetical protein
MGIGRVDANNRTHMPEGVRSGGQFATERAAEPTGLLVRGNARQDLSAARSVYVRAQRDIQWRAAENITRALQADFCAELQSEYPDATWVAFESDEDDSVVRVVLLDENRFPLPEGSGPTDLLRNGWDIQEAKRFSREPVRIAGTAAWSADGAPPVPDGTFPQPISFEDARAAKALRASLESMTYGPGPVHGVGIRGLMQG